MMDKSDEEKPSSEISQATTSNAGTSQDLFLQNQKRKMEEGGINMAHNGRQKADVRIARSQTFPRTCHHSIMIGSIARSPTFPSPSATNRIASNSRPSQGEDPSPSATNGIASNSGPSQGEDPIPSATNGIASNSGPSQGEDPSPSPTNGIASNSGPSQGEDPSPNPTNGRERTLDEYRAQCSPLLQAAIKGDWPDAKAFLEKLPEYVRAPITIEEWTALHAAVIAQRTSFVKELLKLIRDRTDSQDVMKLKTNYGFTALHCAAQSGIVTIAKELVEINHELPWIPDYEGGDVPLNVAAYLGRRAKMVLYLLPLTYEDRERLTDKNRTELLRYTIYNELYDVALKILATDPEIPEIYVESAKTTCGWSVLKMLASKPFAIGSESQLSSWKSLLKYSWFKGIYNKALMKTSAHRLVKRLWKIVGNPERLFSSDLGRYEIIKVIFEAAKVGNVEFLIILSHSYPDLLWQLNENHMSIFHIAIEYRQENVFNLIYEIGTTKDSIASYYTSNEENMLHLVGKLPSSDRLNIVSGAALQMQRELLWFKEIEKIVPSSFMNDKNSNDKTPKELFLKEHTSLQKEGEKWMKDTANYCMLVATLIATVIFAATITIPGGNNQETGTPIFFRTTWFMVFFISNAIALGSSSTSIVIFLSILTSRYTDEDFLTSLPSKLVFGLATLFISMTGMMGAFIATCFLVYSTKRAWAPVIVITSASLPVTSFVLLHGKLWVDTLFSTYKSRFLFRPNKHRLFPRKMPIGESIRRNCWSFTGC